MGGAPVDTPRGNIDARWKGAVLERATGVDTPWRSAPTAEGPTSRRLRPAQRRRRHAARQRGGGLPPPSGGSLLRQEPPTSAEGEKGGEMEVEEVRYESGSGEEMEE